MIRNFKKKPVVIQAVKFEDTAECLEQLVKLGLDPVNVNYSKDNSAGGKPVLKIHTLEGIHEGREGDYIIRGVEGEFYPCKPDIFAKTYDEVDLSESQ